MACCHRKTTAGFPTVWFKSAPLDNGSAWSGSHGQYKELEPNAGSAAAVSGRAASAAAESHLEVDLAVGQAVGVDLVQEVDVFDEEVEDGDDDFLAVAVGSLGALRRSLQRCAVVAEVAGWVHVMLVFQRGEKGEQLSNTFPKN